MQSIPVIDIFAGPGGLGEGFSAYCNGHGDQRFRIGLSIEKEKWAHETLELRSFLRQFRNKDVPDEYYEHICDPLCFPRDELFRRHPDQSTAAKSEAWHATLGEVSESEVDRRIVTSLDGNASWVFNWRRFTNRHWKHHPQWSQNW